MGLKGKETLSSGATGSVVLVTRYHDRGNQMERQGVHYHCTRDEVSAVSMYTSSLDERDAST